MSSSDSGMVSVNREDLATIVECWEAGQRPAWGPDGHGWMWWAYTLACAVLDAPSEPPVVETPSDLADSERSDAAMTIHRPSYLAGWNDAKAGRQYGEGRSPSEPEGPPTTNRLPVSTDLVGGPPSPTLPDAPSEDLAHPLSCFVPMCAYCEALRQRDAR